MLKKCMASPLAMAVFGLGAFCVVGLAVWIQVNYGLDPCPLCIVQRLLCLALGVLLLCSAVLRRTPLLLLVLQLAVALSGMAVAGRHWWLQAHPEVSASDCGVGLDYMIEHFHLSKIFILLLRGSGDCSVVNWHWLGLSLPQLSLLFFATLACYLCWWWKHHA